MSNLRSDDHASHLPAGIHATVDGPDFKEKYHVTDLRSGDTLEEGTYFVLRAQDVFALQTLYSYSNDILNFTHLMEQLEIEVAPEHLSNMHAASDAASRLAELWIMAPKKIPSP